MPAGLACAAGDSLPMSLCQGYTITLTEQQQHAPPTPGDSSSQPGTHAADALCSTAASMLGAPYLARQGNHMVVGATKVYDFPLQQALVECSRRIPMHEAAAAAQQLIPPGSLSAVGGAVSAGPSCHADADDVYLGTELDRRREGKAADVRPASASAEQASEAESGVRERYRLVGAKSGVRAMPPRTQQGAMPLAGKLPGQGLDTR